MQQRAAHRIVYARPELLPVTDARRVRCKDISSSKYQLFQPIINPSLATTYSRLEESSPFSNYRG